MSGNVTITQTFTSVHTTTQQLPPSGLVFGIPYYLLALFIVAAVIMVYAYFKLQVRDVPVRVLWMFRDHSAKLFTAKEDMEAIFLNVRSIIGKKTTIIERGAALDVELVGAKTETYYIADKKHNGLDNETREKLVANGFKIEDRTDRKGTIKGVLIKKEINGKKTVFLNTALGGNSRMKLYGAVEGTGQTADMIDFGKGIDESKASSGPNAVIHEETSAAKKAFAILAEAGSSMMQNLLFLGSGFAFGAMVILLVVVLTGHLK